MAKIVFVIVVAVILLGSGSFFYFTKVNKSNPFISPTPAQIISLTSTPVITQTPAASPSTEVSPKGATKYTSEKLGISFYYLETQPGSIKFKAAEIVNKIYVYQQNFNPESGQFVEVFTKSENDTLKDAVKKRFLANISEKDCFVNSGAYMKEYPALYETAIIDYAVPTDTGDQPFWSYGEKCPQDYSKTNGIRYFLEDTNHPDKFVFFSIGQYGIGASLDNNQLLWQHTIRFTD